MVKRAAALALAILAASCSETPPVASCASDTSCETGSYCAGGRCARLPDGFAVVVAPTLVVTAGGKAQLVVTSVGEVQWSVREGDSGGTIDTSGAYQAPEAAGLYHLVATSTADPSKSAITQATVVARPVAPIISTAAFVTTGDTNITASVAARPASAYHWTNAAGSRSSAGTASATVVPPPVTPVITTASPLVTATDGLTASVPARAGMTYEWSIAGGDITGAGPSGVTNGATNTITYSSRLVCALTLACLERNAAGAASAPGSATIFAAGSLVVATNQNGPLALALDDSYVYWTTTYGSSTSGSVMRAPLQGGPPEPVATGQNAPNSVAVDGTSAYFTVPQNGAVMKVALGGGTPAQIGTGVRPWTVKVDGTSVYWTDPSSSLVTKALLDGGSPQPLATGDEPKPLAIDGESAYWAAGPAGNVLKVALDGGATQPLAIGQGFPNAIAVDSNSVYWTTQTGRTVMQVPLGGGISKQLADAGIEPRGIATDGINVYWTDSGGGAVMRVPLDGGSPVPIATGQNTPQGIVVDDSCVYWTNIDGKSVMKAAK
jgi:hypothetical protein